MPRFMERDIETKLIVWKESAYRKPLILRGARQVGKTRALKEFERRHYENVAYFSLEKINEQTPSEFSQFFVTTKGPRRIIANLTLAKGEIIQPGSTLVILDEIQDCPEALNSLKYFCEDAPEYHIACAGSLLGVALASKGSFPAGKITFEDMDPMTFSEFLGATNEKLYADYCEVIESIELIPDMFDKRLKELLRTYFTIGGMPEAVSIWAETSNARIAEKSLSDLLGSYERNFAKHGGSSAYPRIARVWTSLPSQLARENKRFLYRLVRDGARAREYENAIVWLENAGLFHRVTRSSKPGIPLAAYDENEIFKIYSLDVGVLRKQANMDITTFSLDEKLFSELKGAFAENYVLQSLAHQLENKPRYWTNDKPKHEVDFLIEVDNHVIPIEVKPGENVKSPSLRYYANHYPDITPLRVRFSLRNLSLDGGLLNIPLYLADQASRLIRIALKELGE